MAKSNKTSKLTNVEVIKEGGEYFLALEYLLEDDNRVEKLTIPRAKLPIADSVYPEIFSEEEFGLRFGVHSPRLNLRAGYSEVSLPLTLGVFDGYNAYFKYETIKEKEHEMTIKEIEKKLGYKVKIVSGDKKKR